MRFYTGKGDSGDTDLLGSRVGKDDPRIELIGDIDETTSSIGFARASASDHSARRMVRRHSTRLVQDHGRTRLYR